MWTDHLFFLALFLLISFVFSANIYVDKRISAYDAENNTRIFVNYDKNSDDEIIPPPPGSELLRTRKTRGRTESFHKSDEEMKGLDVKEVFASPKSFEFEYRDDRVDSGNTIVEEWEGFIMDYDSLYPTRSNSTESVKPVVKNSSFDSEKLKKVFASLSQSRSFRTNSTKSISTLPSYTEELELEDLEN